MVETPVPREPVAVIDIGSSAIRMVIAEVGPKMEIRTLENLQKPVRFGKDVFQTGRISSTVVHEAINILKDYKAIIESYNIKRLNAIATSAIREAANRDNFVDQVFVRAGIDVEVIEDAEENRLELIAVEHALKDKVDYEKKHCLIIEVGTGHTELILMVKGEVRLTRALAVGSIRLPERMSAGKTDAAVLQRGIRRIVQDAAREFNLKEVECFVALGSDLRFVTRQLDEKLSGGFVTIQRRVFLDFIKPLSKMPVEDIAQTYVLSYEEAEQLYPALVIYAGFLAETSTNEIVVPMMSIRDGLLLEMAQLLSGYKRTDLSRQVMFSAKNLAKKYHYDEAHASVVTGLALKLFDALKEDHGMGSRERMLLEVSAIVHDIGTYISMTSHHKHGAYLVDNSEFFGLRKMDKNVVSNVVRYHRRSSPKPTHVSYMSLARSERAVVSKLAAILRVADALDRSRQQKIRDFILEKAVGSYALWVDEASGDISIERQGLAEKGEMFADVFGASIALKQGAPPKKV